MTPPPGDPPRSLPGMRVIRAVPPGRALEWYSEALRLFKRAPVRFGLIAVAVAMLQIVLSLIPLVGPPAANVIVPIFASSLLFAALAVDRGDKPRALHLVAPFAAPVQAIAAVIAAALCVSGAEWLAGWHFAGANILSIEDITDLAASDYVLVYVTGVAVSLPLTLVPLLAFFEGAGVRDAFAGSAQAFARNVPAFVLYGVLSVLLLALVMVTQGIAMPIVLPLWAASSYAAWKDLFGAA